MIVRRAYSLDLRQHALDALAGGRTQTEVAQIVGISVRTLQRYRHQLAVSETLAAKPVPGRPRRLPPEQEAGLDAQLRAHPAATLAEHCGHWAADHGVQLSGLTMG